MHTPGDNPDAVAGVAAPLDWAKLKDVVADAFELPITERDAFIRQSCAGSETLLIEAIALVKAQEHNSEAAHVLHPLIDAFAGLTGPDPAALTGKRIGKYELIHLLGEGAMAAVYLARQDGVERPVALKILRSDAMSYDAHRRFTQEVAAQGRIEHPGVARIFEAGEAADASVPGARGIRYIAMEYVDGPPLTVWARQKNLSLTDRIRLFADVADAVHAAHQRAIIHRDLKPANVLVADDGGYGRPKVLDFGIARVLQNIDDAEQTSASSIKTSRTFRTTAGVLLGTLGYMSPEQAGGDADADLRSDIWTLGVMLHELVTGRLPVPVTGLSLAVAMKRLIEPNITPGTIGTIADDETGGDLTAILTTALSPELERRYASAGLMANDLRRMLRHEPVIARAPTRRYLARKFARRHRAGVVATTIVLASLVATTAFSTASFLRESKARGTAVTARAEAEAALTEALAQTMRAQAARGFMAHILESADIDSVGAKPKATILDAVRAAEPKLSEYVKGDAVLEAEIRQTLARSLRSLGEIDAADAQYSAAIDAARRAVDNASAPSAAWAVEPVVERIGMLVNESRATQARSFYESLRAQIRSLDDARAVEQLSLEADKALAGLLSAEGDFDGSADLWLTLLSKVEGQLSRAGESDAREADQFATMQNNAASALTDCGRLDEAASLLSRTIEYRKQRYGLSHPITLRAMQNLAFTLDNQGELDQAEAISKSVLTDGTGRLDADHPTLAGARSVLISVLTQRQDDVSLEKAVRLADENIAGLDRRGLGKSADMAIALNNRAIALGYLNRLDDAAATYRRAVEIGTDTLGEDHPMMLSARGNLGQALHDLGQYEAGVGHMRAVYEIRRKTLGDDNRSTVISRNNLAMLAIDAKDAAGCEDSARELAACVAISERESWNAVTPALRRNLGRALMATGQFEKAEQALIRAYEEGAEISPVHQRRAAGYLADLYEKWSRPADAAKWRAVASSTSK